MSFLRGIFFLPLFLQFLDTLSVIDRPKSKLLLCVTWVAGQCCALAIWTKVRSKVIKICDTPFVPVCSSPFFSKVSSGHCLTHFIRRPVVYHQDARRIIVEINRVGLGNYCTFDLHDFSIKKINVHYFGWSL
jgi:hypothetical protein